MILKTLFFVLLVSHGTYGNHAEFSSILEYFTPYAESCDPDLACEEAGEPGAYVADPSDCHNFYVCVTIEGEVVPSDSSVACPEGDYFNATTASCEEEIEPCSIYCPSSCSLVCPDDPYHVVGDPTDCNKYYFCILGGEKVPQDCPPEKPYFDGGNCTNDISKCCDFCSPSCPSVGVQVPDPCDCTKFYICISTGTPDENTHAQCSDGQYFDFEEGTCVIGTECDSLCPCGRTTEQATTTKKPTTDELTTTTTTASTTTTPTSTTTTDSTTKTTTSTTTTTTTTDPGDGCANSLTCTAAGDFPRCTGCDPTYFHCDSAGSAGQIDQCPNDTVFNPNPDYPYCVLPSQCPRSKLSD